MDAQRDGCLGGVLGVGVEGGGTCVLVASMDLSDFRKPVNSDDTGLPQGGPSITGSSHPLKNPTVSSGRSDYCEGGGGLGYRESC